MVENSHRRTYQDDGYCLVENLIPRDVIEAGSRRVLELIEASPDWAPQSGQFLNPARATNREGKPVPIGLQQPSHYDPVFNTIARHPKLIAGMSALLGGEVELFTDQIGIKHGFITEEAGGRSYYHQDSFYWKIDPELGANCWIPFDEVGPNASALAVKPGSQSGWVLHPHESYQDDPAWGQVTSAGFKAFPRWRIPTGEVDFSDEILFPMKPGDGLFFTNYTWHRSEPNRTGETRMFYAIAYKLTPDAIAKKRSDGA